MLSAQQLWQQYHAAVKEGKMDLAKTILKSLQAYKGNPSPPKGGCSTCKKRLR